MAPREGRPPTRKYQPPNPRPFPPQPGEESPLRKRVGTAIESTDRLFNKATLAALVALGALHLYEMGTKPEGPAAPSVTETQPTPSLRETKATPKKPEQEHAQLIARLKDLPALLDSPERLKKEAPDLSRALSSAESTADRCVIIRDVLNNHLNDILKISLYLSRHAPEIQDEKLSADFQKQLRDVLQMQPEQVKTEAPRAFTILQGRIKGTNTYKVLQSCNRLVLFLVQGFLAEGIEKQRGKTRPIVDEIVNHIGKREWALETAQALDRIRSSLVR